MKTYIYQIKDSKGRVFRGFESAADKKQLRAKISHLNCFFISAQPANRKEIFNRKVRSQQLLLFTTRLLSLIDAGIPILGAMTSLWRQTDDQTFQLAISYILRKLSEGSSLSGAMEAFPNIFSGVYLAMIKVAEETGELVLILQNLASYLEYQKMVVGKIKKATTYPIIVICLAIILMMSMFTFIVPVFAGLLEGLDVELPALTKFVLGISRGMRTWLFWGIFLTVIVGTGVTVKILMKRKGFVLWFDRVKLKIPIFGNLMYMMLISRFVNSLKMLLKAGLSILMSLQSSIEVVRNVYFQNAIRKMSMDIEQGMSMEDAFLKTTIFPDMVIEMVGVGEASGDMVNVLGKAGSYLEEEVDLRVTRMLTMLEPMLIVIVGGMIAVTLVAIYLPIVAMWQGI